jgi:hypothetical protein
MKKVLIITTLLTGLFSIGEFARGQAAFQVKSKTFALAAESQNAQGLTLVHVDIRDAKAKSGVCPYYVKSMQFLEAVRILNVEIYQEVCVNEAFGVSKGEIFWVVPKSLQAKGQTITVLVNQTQAGALVFDEAKQSFNVKGEVGE